MAPPSCRSVITGIGLVTPLGVGVDPFRDALRQGTSGVRRITSFDVTGLPVQIGAEVVDFDPRACIDKKDRKRLGSMARTMQLAVVASRLAVVDAGLDRDHPVPERFGVVIGSGIIPGDLADLGPAAQASVGGPRRSVDLRRWGETGVATIPPMWMLNHIPNMTACHVSIMHDARGPNNTITQSEAAGLLALAEGRRVLERGRADVMLVGAADTRTNPLCLARQELFSRLSHRNDAPATACRPFDRDRDGQVLGEGACVLVLETREHAQQRGAAVLAELCGCGSAFDRGKTGHGLARAVRAALTEAGIGPEAVDHVNAHGLGTPIEDAWEARGLAEAFAGCDRPVPVFAPKSYFGNLGAAGGLVELAASVVALRAGVVPGTLNYENADPQCPVFVACRPRPVSSPWVVATSLTEMGHCAAAVLHSGDGLAPGVIADAPSDPPVYVR